MAIHEQTSSWDVLCALGIFNQPSQLLNPPPPRSGIHFGYEQAWVRESNWIVREYITLWLETPNTVKSRPKIARDFAKAS